MIHDNPVALLQTLLRFDTSNPPGDELACIRYLNGVLQSYGVETALLALDELRPNLLARIKGSGQAPPLLLQGHVDVVPIAGQDWTYGAFSAEIHDGYLWGRGTLDMKGGVAMLVAAFLKLKHSGVTPRGDIILCLLADEEHGSEFGAKFLVEQHAEQFAGVRYGIGEFGGFPMQVGGAKCYPIQVAERVGCGLKLTIRGQAGHGAIPIRDQAMAKLGRILTQLNNNKLPVHITPPARLMVEGMAQAAGGATALLMRGLLNPKLNPSIINALGPRLSTLEPMFRNTVNPTMLTASSAINVVPGEITLTLDGRMLPGFTATQMIAEVKAVVGNEVEIEQIGQGVPQKAQPDMGLFPLLSSILRHYDPAGSPIPFMLPAVTDGRYFSTLGIQHYGFLPLNLPQDFNFSAYVHAADERVPVEAIRFGANCLYDLLVQYNG